MLPEPPNPSKLCPLPPFVSSSFHVAPSSLSASPALPPPPLSRCRFRYPFLTVQESDEFLQMFSDSGGVRYLKGGVTGGFSKASKSPFPRGLRQHESSFGPSLFLACRFRRTSLTRRSSV